MSNVTVRELRNKSADVLARIGRGEQLTVTRDGEPVALMLPVPRRPLGPEQLVERWRNLPRLDLHQLRSDVDDVVDQGL